MAGSSLLVLSLVTTVFLLEYVAAENATYYAYSITSERVCSRYHKKELQVTMKTPILLEGKDLENITLSEPISCKYEVEHKSFIQSGGVVGVIQKMKFRRTGDLCLDYMQTVYHGNRSGNYYKDKTKFGKDYSRSNFSIIKRDHHVEDERGPKKCGNILFGVHVDENETLPPPFAAPLPPHPPSTSHHFAKELAWNPYMTVTADGAEIDPKGELQSYLFMSNRMLRVNEFLELSIVYSAYKVCNGRSVPEELFHCGYGLCISRTLVNDGFVNCPFGDCIDEVNCTNAKNSTINATLMWYTTQYGTGGPIEVSGTALLSLAGLAVLIGLICYCVRKKNRANKNKTQDENEEEEEAQEMQPDLNKDQTEYPQPGYTSQGQPGYQPPQGYPQPGYPPPQGYPQPGYPPPQQGYPAPQGYPPPQGQPGYPPGQPGYPPGQPGYPPPQGQPMYPGAGYPPPQGGPPGVAPPLPEGAIGFNLPPTFPGATPGPSSGEATAPSAPI